MMKKILLQAIGSVSEKRIARMLELELAERGVSCTYEKGGELCSAVFIVSQIDSDTAAKIRNMSLSVPIICCYLRNELALLDGVHCLERPFDAAKLSDSLARLASRGKNTKRGLEFLDGQVTFDGEKISLTKKERSLLELLYKNRGKAVARDEAERLVFGTEGGSNAVDVYVKYLRTKLDERFGQKLIVTVRNKGYMLK